MKQPYINQKAGSIYNHLRYDYIQSKSRLYLEPLVQLLHLLKRAVSTDTQEFWT